MKKIKILLGLLLITFAFISCEPSDSNSNSNDNFAENFGSAVNRSFIGQVVDTDNHALQNVTITIGTSTVQTDVNGVFIINDASVFEKFAHIKATKAGYVDGSRSMVPTAGKNNIRIMLIPNTPLQTVTSGVASEVALPSGTKVNFDGAFQDESGAIYTGAVQVAMFHLKSSDENLSSLMPGMLYAERENGDEAVLETFGMLNVELRGSGGQKLNIANGHTAQITMKIDDSQTTTAPSSIPLWHFDEEGGYWKEDGVATKVGSNYVGTVSHFSWWNCDMSNSSILLTFTLADSNGNLLSNTYINLINSAGEHANGTTDENGQLSGILPANQTFTVNVYNGSLTASSSGCGIIYSTTIGPYSSDTIVPTIVVNSPSLVSARVTGTLLKCDNSNCMNGYVIVHFGYQSTLVRVTNGTFDFNIINCSGNLAFTLQGYDYESLQTTGVINYTLVAPATNVGVIKACNTIPEFVSYNYDGQDYFHVVIHPQPLSGSSYTIQSENMSGITSRIYITSSVTVPGLYTPSYFNLSVQRGSTTYVCSYLFSDNTVKFRLNHYGAIGDYIDLDFAGNFRTGVGGVDLHTISGTAHVLRVY